MITVRKSRLSGHWVCTWGTNPSDRQAWRRWEDAIGQATAIATTRRRVWHYRAGALV